MRCPAGRGVRTGAIKTDRRDARKLVRLLRAGELTPIHVPDEAEEAARDLVRCREAVRRDVVRWRHRLLKLLDRHGRLWVTEKNWTQRHWTWIRAQHFELPALQRAFEATVFALEQALARQAALDQEIEALAATAPYREPVGWLRCFRGIGTLSAMVLLAEIVDFQRFRRPRELMAYLGLVPSEYSSGETQRRGALTKAGNTHARRVLIEAAWHYRHRPSVGRALASRSQAQPAEVVGQAWRAQQRKSSASSREFHGCPCRSRDRRRPNKPLDGRSFHISRLLAQYTRALHEQVARDTDRLSRVRLFRGRCRARKLNLDWLAASAVVSRWRCPGPGSSSVTAITTRKRSKACCRISQRCSARGSSTSGATRICVEASSGVTRSPRRSTAPVSPCC